jgi:anti-anti-sigma factor
MREEYFSEVLTIYLDQNFTFKEYEEFKKIMNKIVYSKVKVIVLDMRETTHIDSSALGSLILLHEMCDSVKPPIKVMISNTNRSVLSILNIANFNKLFEIT